MIVTTKNLKKILKSKVLNTTSRKDLEKVKDPESLPKWKRKGKPSKTYWRAINHSVLADMVIAQVNNLGLKLVSETWILCMTDQMGLMAELELATTSEMELLEYFPESLVENLFAVEDAGMSMRLLFRHSNNARWALHFLPAMQDDKFETGWVYGPFGSLGVQRKHSECMGLRQYIYDSIIACLSGYRFILNRLSIFNKRDLSIEQGDHLIVQAGIEQAIPWRYLPEVARTWRKRKHKFFADGSTVRSLYNCFAEIIKERSPRELAETLFRCSDVLMKYCSNGVDQVHDVPVLDDSLTVEEMANLSSEQILQLKEYEENRPDEDLFEELDRTDDGDTFWEAFESGAEDT